MRHICTNYDKLTVFYASLPEYRYELNVVCDLFVRGKITEEQFDVNVKKIENAVDLTRKKARKNFIKKKTEEFIAEKYNKNMAELMAEEHLFRCLHKQIKQNSKRAGR
ncbi:MAG: hypothetical protein LBD94_01455 [Rickettsiales bacterium]|nr:hypothetical protein [Rickettsiales bacterium]